MNTLLQKIKKNCALVLALLMGLTTTACQIPFPIPSGSSLSEESTAIESETSSNFDSDNSQGSTSTEDAEDDNSTDNEQDNNGSSDDGNGDIPDDGEQDGGETDGEEDDEALQEAKRIMDEAYALATGESLPGTYTLTGTITYIYTDYTASKGICLYMDVLEPASREMYCYQLKGTGADIISEGDTITVQGTIKNYKGTVEFDKGCTLVSYTLADGSQGSTPDSGDDPYKNMSKSEFYATYTVATSNEDAYYRSLHGFMSGELTVPDQAPTLSPYRPKVGTAYVRNSEMQYEEDGKAYVVTDVYGEEAFTVYKDGAYITLEEVAAYVYAFGTYPKNYTPSKSTSPSSSVWAEYLRVNHTQFSGSTSKYPYEPELPNITGCGGTLSYYEMDIGTTGTDCDPSYTAELYNNGYSITRGAARIVYGKRDLNGDGIFGTGEHYVFYTYNHYNDFQEYLNYEGGWGEMFGNITGGGTISSKYDYNPTAYPSVVMASLTEPANSLSRKTLLTRYFGL
ncbi:MAG: hypothetical protein J6S04_02885 [Clostridia bacterium]|nr:hypothetical protein [Clostridia bacterium]